MAVNCRSINNKICYQQFTGNDKAYSVPWNRIMPSYNSISDHEIYPSNNLGYRKDRNEDHDGAALILVDNNVPSSRLTLLLGHSNLFSAVSDYRLVY